MLQQSICLLLCTPFAFMVLDYAHFQALPDSQQDRYVQKHGKFRAHRWHENYSIELYDLGSFYCEQWLEQECVHPPRYQAFPSEACLESYAQPLALACY